MTVRTLLVLGQMICWTGLIAQNANPSQGTADSSTKAPASHNTKGSRYKDVKNILPDSGKAVVYIVRPSIMAFAIPMRVDVDSFQVGWLPTKAFLYTILDAGEHNFSSRSENEFHLPLRLESGKVYYIEEEAKMGWVYARTKLKVISEEAGKKELSKCGLSSSNRYPEFPLSRNMEKSPPRH